MTNTTKTSRQISRNPPICPKYRSNVIDLDAHKKTSPLLMPGVFQLLTMQAVALAGLLAGVTGIYDIAVTTTEPRKIRPFLRNI